MSATIAQTFEGQTRKDNATDGSVPDTAAKATVTRPANITSVRRANEILQIMQKAGGILNTSGSDIHRKHEEVLRALSEAGEMISAPVGTRMDRRTLSYTLERLEETGRIRLMTITTQSEGRQRYAYLPTTKEEDVRRYIEEQQAAKTAQIELTRKVLKSKRVVQNPPEAVAERRYSESSPSNAVALVFSTPQTQRKDPVVKKQKKERAEKEMLRVQQELNAVKIREHAWNALVRKVRPGLLKGVAETRLRKLRRSYVTRTKVQEEAQWEMEISEAIMAAEKIRLYRSMPKLKPRQQPKLDLIQFKTQNQPAVDMENQNVVQHGEPIEYLIDLQDHESEIIESRSIGETVGEGGCLNICYC